MLQTEGKKRILRLHLATTILALTIALPALAQDAEGNPPMQFDNYWMVFLVRGDNPPQLDDTASAELQRRHLAHLNKIFSEGYTLVGGPFEVPADDPVRGIVLFRGDLERERVVELANADPAVVAGRLKVEVKKWLTAAGALSFPLRDEKN